MDGSSERRRERHRRIRWIKRLLRPMPRRATIHRYPVLKWFAEAARRRHYLWSFRVSEMAPAFYAGMVLSFLPLYGFQILLALVLAMVLRANLPVFVGLQLVTNPFTIVPICWATFWVGAWIMGLFGHPVPPMVFHEDGRWMTELLQGAGSRVAALVIGSVVGGLVVGAVLDLVYRFLAYEARKHHWHLPIRVGKKSASPPPPIDPEI